ncbi:MAG: hypothetical protein U9Q77_00895 [Candidatus Marinimicrobia bacterium]|nr:hypothetical protein [Candidatus Neomarinimicrobiota bacterium]
MKNTELTNRIVGYQMLVKIKTLITLVVSLVVLLGLIGCERDTGVLSPAPPPTDAEVFMDGFGPGVQYYAFDNSKLDALGIDNSEYYSGASSIKISVPGVGHSYAGGVFTTAGLRDLSSYDALTFWAKSSRYVGLKNALGMGNDFINLDYVATLDTVSLTTEWKKYSIPLPRPELHTAQGGLFTFSIAEKYEFGYDIWIDELRYEHLGTIAHPAADIGTKSMVAFQYTTIPITTEATVHYDVSSTGVDVVVKPAYLTFSSSDSTVVSINEDGTMTLNNLGSAVITAKMGELDASGSLTVTVDSAPESAATDPTQDPADVLSLFSDSYASVTSNMDWYTYWTWSTAEVNEFDIDSNNMMLYTTLNFAGVEFLDQQVDASDMTHFHMDIWTPDYVGAGSFELQVNDFGPDGAYGGGDDVSHVLILSASSNPALVSDSWISIDVPMSAFSGSTAQSNLAQLVFAFSGGGLKTVFVDNIYLYR